MKSVLARIWQGVTWCFRSTWLVPVLCLVLVGQLVLPVLIFCGGPRTSILGSWVLGISSLAAVLAFPLMGLWFISSCFLKQTWGSRGLRLLWSVLCGGAACVIFACCALALMFQNNDHAADDWTVPEGVAFDVPENFWVEESAPDIVKRLAGKNDNSHSRDVHVHPLPDGDFPKQTPHLALLAQEHPELLRELWQRAELLHNRELMKKEEDDPHGPQDAWYRCLAYLTPAKDASTPSELWGYKEQQLTTMELGKGWQLRMATRSVMDREQGRAESDERLEGYTLQQLDAAFAELAERPTCETLDAMLPLPSPPHLHLCQGFQPGIYDLTLLLPKDARTDGHYEIRAYEYNTGEELSLDSEARDIRLTKAQDSRQRVWELDTIRAWELDTIRAWTMTHFMVFTGDWGQYYGSRWEVWFVPKEGEREKVCEQNFLMQGWMR